jgi:hypothetical protein
VAGNKQKVSQPKEDQLKDRPADNRSNRQRRQSDNESYQKNRQGDKESH